MTHCVKLKKVGGFKDKLGSNVDELPACTVDETTAGARLIALKQKINELQDKRESFHLRQGVTAGAAVTKGGTVGAIGGAISGLHQRGKIKDIIEEIEACIDQVNILRAAFESTAGWSAVEAQCKINEKVFDKKAIDRKSLKGCL